ncbi:amino acid deaminase [Pseudoxanthobacter sp. M-2]|uniref:amino acid deaminase n=1 Tax=Pseudoxanthobacter sp. M-2 TaxID=3078754 RepID=UPI0038FC852B
MPSAVPPSPEAPLTPLDKAVPADAGAVPLEAVAALGWNVLREDVPLPVAVIRRERLSHNSAWMRRFLADCGADIAPHGKTTMSPWLFDLQIADGAWAMTVGTPHQLQVARAFGHKRLVLANQLVGRSAIDQVMCDLRDHPDFEFYCLVDSLPNVAALAAAARRHGLTRPLTVLVELGYPGGRTGCRTVDEALAVARAVHGSAGALALAGVEGFEGLLRGESNAATLSLVEDFLDRLVALAERCDAEELFAADPVLLSAGGSSHFDVVAHKLRAARLGRPTRVLLRSGCYITHDSGLYVRAQEGMRERDPALADRDGGLLPALEVWAYVQSRPEAGKAIAGLGKRDVSHDDPPVPLAWFRPDGSMDRPQPIADGTHATRLNDQHCHLTVPASSPLQVGDLVAFGVSHPCLTFDKWRALYLVDEAYDIVGAIRTYF